METVNSSVDSSAIPKDPTHLYFPLKPRHSTHDSSFHTVALPPSTNKWFSKHLYTLKEPILTNYPEAREVYRFTWLRSFHPPIVVRVEHLENITFLTVKMSDGAGGYEPGKVIKDSTIAVRASQWKSLLSKIKRLDFWMLSPADTNWRRLGMDGAQWVLEGKKKSQYHFAYRWSPVEKEYDNFRDVCEYMLSLARFTESELPRDTKY